jgi:hypothetical protein
MSFLALLLTGAGSALPECLGACHAEQPFEIGGGAQDNRKGNDLGDGIRMEGCNLPLNVREAVFFCLDQKKPFFFIPDLSLPPIDGAHRRDDIDARGQTILHKAAGDLGGLLFGTACDKDEKRLGRRMLISFTH